jgi:hypothetical protein
MDRMGDFFLKEYERCLKRELDLRERKRGASGEEENRVQVQI